MKPYFKTMRFLATIVLLFASPAFAAPPVYVSLKSQFKSFIEKAQNKDFETQLQIWQTEVESALPKIYSELLSQNPDKTLEQNRHDKAKKWFPFLLAHSDKILAQFDTFDKYGWPMAERLSANYPQVDFSEVRVIAMPSLMSFNGQVMTSEGKLTAMFGMDFLQLVDENPKLMDGSDLINNTAVLVAHEFTHALHGKLLESSGEDFSNFGLYAPLWQEGLAQVHSQMLVSGTDQATVFMERNLAAQCTPDHVVAWAQTFLKDLDKTSDVDTEANHSKWFFMNDWKVLGVPRAGYCLGYHVILSALREHSFNELINMKPSDASVVAKKSLMSMKAPQCQSIIVNSNFPGEGSVTKIFSE